MSQDAINKSMVAISALDGAVQQNADTFTSIRQSVQSIIEKITQLQQLITELKTQRELCKTELAQLRNGNQSPVNQDEINRLVTQITTLTEKIKAATLLINKANDDPAPINLTKISDPLDAMISDITAYNSSQGTGPSRPPPPGTGTAATGTANAANAANANAANAIAAANALKEDFTNFDNITKYIKLLEYIPSNYYGGMTDDQLNNFKNVILTAYAEANKTNATPERKNHISQISTKAISDITNNMNDPFTGGKRHRCRNKRRTRATKSKRKKSKRTKRRLSKRQRRK